MPCQKEASIQDDVAHYSGSVCKAVANIMLVTVLTTTGCHGAIPPAMRDASQLGPAASQWSTDYQGPLDPFSCRYIGTPLIGFQGLLRRQRRFGTNGCRHENHFFKPMHDIEILRQKG